MSKEFKLVFEPRMKSGDVLTKRGNLYKNNLQYLQLENGNFKHVSVEDQEEHDFNIGDEWILVANTDWDMIDDRPKGMTTTLTKIL